MEYRENGCPFCEIPQIGQIFNNNVGKEALGNAVSLLEKQEVGGSNLPTTTHLTQLEVRLIEIKFSGISARFFILVTVWPRNKHSVYLRLKFREQEFGSSDIPIPNYITYTSS